MQFVLLRPQKLNRRIDDLQCDGLKIVQDPEKYCFTSDSVLLANFFNAKNGDTVAELCSGSGVISILGTKKTKAKSFFCFEIQKELFDLSIQSIKLNKIENIFAYNLPLAEAPKVLGKESVNVVVVNPPYYTEKTRGENPSITIATHEVKTNLQQIVETASSLLKYGGNFYMVHQSKRFAEICQVLKNNKLEPKHVVFVRPNKDKPINVVLVKATKNAKVGMTIDELVLQNKDGSLTKEAEKYYGKTK